MVDHLAGFLIAQRPFALTLILCSSPMAPSPLAGWPLARPSHRQGIEPVQAARAGLAILYVTDWGPAWLMTPDRLPFLFDKLAMSVGLIVPIGAMALTFLLGFGLLEFIGC